MFATLASKPLRFLATAVLTFAVLLAVWPSVSPLYARATAAVGEGLLKALSLMPPGSRLEARERRVWVFRPVAKIDGSPGTAGINVLDDATYFNALLFASLVAATPALRWRAKAKAFCLGAGLLWLVHLADLYVKLRWTAIHPGLRLHGVVPEPASIATIKLFEWLYAFFSVIGFGLFPIIIWIGAVSLWWPCKAGAAARTLEDIGAEGKRRQNLS